MPRVRSVDAVLAAIIQEGIARSKTFKGLIDSINSTDGIVYVEEGQCLHSVHACLVLSVTVAGPNRILRVLVERRRPKRELIATLGHELRHAVEVLSEPTIRDDRAVISFYQHEGPTDWNQLFETPAAVHAGQDIYDELGARQ
jgi:hypothetical protein